MTITINNRKIGAGHPVYIIAEMSANHSRDFNKALKILNSAKSAGADAVKLQTYTADTLTINCKNEFFRLHDTIWKGRTLYDLYSEAATPWGWYPDLKKQARKIGIDLFSTPFDSSAVDFLEGHDVPAYKVASFEIIDIPLLKKIAAKNKPVILSTGMATLEEIKEAVTTLKNNGCNQVALLKCTSAYPASPEEANLKTLPHLSDTFHLPTGISDHTLGSAVALGAVGLGACIIEKHLTLSRKDPGPDSSFSMEPGEFKKMVTDIRTLEKAMGSIRYGVTKSQEQSRVFRKSLFAVKDIAKGEVISSENIRSIRPGFGMHPRYYDVILGKKALKNIPKGTPLSMDQIQQD